MDEKEAEARPLMGTIFLVLVWQELKKCLERWCSSSLVQFSTPNKAAKSSELSEQEYTDYDLPLALLSLLGQI